MAETVEHAKERWRFVPGCGGMYVVSSRGRLWSAYAGRLLRPSNTPGGYAKAALRGPRRETAYIHRLVCEAFIGPCPAGRQVRHLDGRPGNNHLENLCYGTPTENQSDRDVHGTSQNGHRNPNARVTEDDVRALRRDHESGGVTVQELANKYGISRPQASYIINRKSWKHVV